MINVLYHGPECLDGFTAAWTVLIKHPNAILYPIDYHQPCPVLGKGITYILDFTFEDLEVTRGLIETQFQVIHYDHHATAQPTTAVLEKEFGATGKYLSIWDPTRSGAGITWDSLFSPSPRPKLINYVEDRDLWRFKYPNSHFFTEGLLTLNKTVENWNFAFGPKGRKLLIQIGKERLKDRQERCLKQVQNTTQWLELNLPDRSLAQIPVSAAAEKTDVSDQIDAMLTEFPDSKIVGCWTPIDEHTVKIRLGSREAGPDIAAVAELHGGGGHPHAASFHYERSKLL